MESFFLSLKREMYELEAVFATAAKFTDKCVILIDHNDNSEINVYFEIKNYLEAFELKKISLEFCNELNEQQFRLILEKKFGNMRDLIVKQAFSPISHLKDEIKL